MKAVALGVLVFCLALMADVAWAKYVDAASRRRPISAGLWAMGIGICGTVGTILYVGNHVYAVPAILGMGVGSFVAVSHSKHRGH
jgi:hypothetical protein